MVLLEEQRINSGGPLSKDGAIGRVSFLFELKFCFVRVCETYAYSKISKEDGSVGGMVQGTVGKSE
jgi:hypothetical protein